MRWLIVTVEPVTSVDVTSVDVLEEMDNALRDSGIELGFAEMKDPVKDKLKRFGLFYKMGEQRFFPTVEAVVKQYLAATAVVEGRV